MENKKENLKEHIKKLTTPIFEKAIQSSNGNQPNHMMVGKTHNNPQITYLIQPHNFRLYFNFNKETYNPKKPSNHTLQKYKSMVALFNPAYTQTSLNHDSEQMYKDFLGCTIKVKKKKIEIINNTHKKHWRLIKADSLKEIDERIDHLVNTLKTESIEALSSFIDLHGGKSDCVILNPDNCCEIGIHGDDYIDKIPPEFIIHDTYFKKVYKKKLEFKTIPAVKNYISNRSVEKIAPDIAKPLNQLGGIMEGIAKGQETQYNKVGNIMEGIAKGQETQYNKVGNIMEGIAKVGNIMEGIAKGQESQYKENERVFGLLREQIQSHLALIQEYREESKYMRKPFFIRWWQYFKGGR